jgi:hypothetical protein
MKELMVMMSQIYFLQTWAGQLKLKLYIIQKLFYTNPKFNLKKV